MVALQAKIKEIIPRTYNVKSFRLDVPVENINFKAGQFLELELKNKPGLKRYLSISSSPTERCYLEFTKKITESEFSRNLNSLKAGDEVRIKYPFGNFTLRGGVNKIAFLSGGIGITPIRSICKYATDEKLGLDIVLLYANRSIKEIAFRGDFDFMQNGFSGLKVVHVLCEPAPGFKCSTGLINALTIRNEIPDFAWRKFYLCGPPAMVEAMNKILSEELCLPQENIITENFQGY